MSLVAVFVLLIMHFLQVYSADISSIWSLSPLDLLLIGIWSFVSYSAYAYAVYVMLISAGLKNVGPFGWLRIYFVSRVANFLVIQGGNLFRLFVLKKKYGFSYANSIGVTTLLIWLNAAIALLASSYVFATIDLNNDSFGVSLFAASVLALAGVLSLPLIIVSLVKATENLQLLPAKISEPVLKVSNYFVETIKNHRLMAQIFTLSCVHFAFFVGVNYFSFRALGQQVDVAGVCLFTTALVFTRYVNIVPGNLGLSELIGGLVSELLGIGFGSGLLVVGIVRMTEVLIILLFGLVYGKLLILDFLRNRSTSD